MVRAHGWWWSVLLLVLAVAACNGGLSASRPGADPAGPSTAARVPPAAAPETRPVPPAAPRVPAAVQVQITRGRALYAERCAVCHGVRGEGSDRAPAVVGDDALPLDPPPGARLRRVRFQSAMDLGMFIKTSMPPDGRHLPPQDVACVLAWLLQQHGRTPTEPISPATAGAITR